MADVADLNPDFQARLMALVNASGGRVTINSAYRSVAEQTALWNASDKSGRMVAFPGSSMHNKGLAADLGGDLDWVHQHAAEFGLYFPMSWEPWHIQPIGIDGKSGGQMTAANTVAPPPPTNDPAHGLQVIADALHGHPGAAPTIQDPLKTPTQQTQQPQQQAAGGPNGGPAYSGNERGAALLRDAAEKAGFTGEALNMAVAIGMAESGGDPNATNTAGNSAGTDRGLWQINDYYHRDLFSGGFNWSDPYANARAAFQISDGGKNWGPWATYNSGAYQKYLGTA